MPTLKDIRLSSHSYDSVIQMNRFSQLQTSVCHEQLETLLGREKKYTHNHQLLPIWHDMRKQHVDWQYRITDAFGWPRSVVAKAANIMDAAMLDYQASHKDIQKPLNESELHQHYLYFQKTSIVALAIASKAMGKELGGQGLMNMEGWARLTKGQLTEEALAEHELKILSQLDWHVNAPTPQDFIHEFMGLMPPRDNLHTIYEQAKFETELAVYTPSLFTNHLPSSIGLSALLNAIDSAIQQPPGSNFMTEVDRYIFLDYVNQCVFNDTHYSHYLDSIQQHLSQCVEPIVAGQAKV